MLDISRRWIVSIAFIAGFAGAAGGAATSWAAGPTSVAPDQVKCIPVGGNGAIWATVEDNQPETSVKLYFRRLHDTVEDLYFVDMYPEGEGRFWGVMPKAEKRKLDRHEIEDSRRREEERYLQAAWWRDKEDSDHRNPNQDLDDETIRERASVGKTEDRSWLAQMSDEEFESWINGLEFEPVEYFVAVVGAQGEVVARSPMMAGEVRSADSCDVELTPKQLGEAANLVVGETAPWQEGKPAFHWMCAGVVARVGADGIKRSDGACRQCVPCFDQTNVLNYTVGGAVSPSDFK